MSGRLASMRRAVAERRPCEFAGYDGKTYFGNVVAISRGGGTWWLSVRYYVDGCGDVTAPLATKDMGRVKVL